MRLILTILSAALLASCISAPNKTATPARGVSSVTPEYRLLNANGNTFEFNALFKTAALTFISNLKDMAFTAGAKVTFSRVLVFKGGFFDAGLGTNVYKVTATMTSQSAPQDGFLEIAGMTHHQVVFDNLSDSKNPYGFQGEHRTRDAKVSYSINGNRTEFTNGPGDISEVSDIAPLELYKAFLTFLGAQQIRDHVVGKDGDKRHQITWGAQGEQLLAQYEKNLAAAREAAAPKNLNISQDATIAKYLAQAKPESAKVIPDSINRLFTIQDPHLVGADGKVIQFTMGDGWHGTDFQAVSNTLCGLFGYQEGVVPDYGMLKSAPPPYTSAGWSGTMPQVWLNNEGQAVSYIENSYASGFAKISYIQCRK